MQLMEGILEKILITPEGENISREIPEGEITFEGLVGDCHSGMTLLTHGHHPEFPKGTKIRNDRQFTILSVEELNEVAMTLQIPSLDVSWLTGNLLISGIKNFSVLPYGTRFVFSNGVILSCSGENNPCSHPARITQSHYPEVDGIARDFVKAAIHRRGIVAWTVHPGTIHPGERFHIVLPHPWNPAWQNEAE